MRYALISDIHANLEALDAVLADIAYRGDIDAIYHLGDLVGYSSRPNEVVARIRARAIPGVAGNYDSTVALGYRHCGCRAASPREEALAHISFTFTCAHTSAPTKRVLAALPFRIDVRPLGGHVAGPTIALVHAHVSNALVYVTAGRTDDFLRKLAADAGLRTGDILCFGHTHVPWVRDVDGVRFVNTGSVGRPKDGDWRACYVLLDVDDGGSRVELVRVAYDIDATIAGIRDAGLPDDFAEFLRTGGRSLAPAVT